MTARAEGLSLDGTLVLCEYHTNRCAQSELEAIDEYLLQVTLRPYFDLEELQEGGKGLATALRGRAEELARWHKALTKLMKDPRLENERRHTGMAGPPFDRRGKGPYQAAVTRYLSFAAEDYHGHKAGFEHTVTLWARGRLQPPVNYLPETRRVDYTNGTLTLW